MNHPSALRPRLAAILAALKAHPLAPYLVVFGSVARGTSGPYSDLDVFLDCACREPTPSELGALLALCRRYYGSLDVFLRTQTAGLYVRDEEATDWTRARNARSILRSVRREGVPLSTGEAGAAVGDGTAGQPRK